MSDSEKKDVQVVISFTSYGNRLVSDDIYRFLDSIVKQKCIGINYRVVCTLFKDDLKNIPDKLQRYFDRFGIERIVMDQNFKSHKKYIMSMQKYRNIPVILVDDDNVYDEDMVQILYHKHLQHPGVIIGSRVRKIAYDKNGHALKYKQWKFVEDEVPQLDLLATTGGGTLFPPEFSKLVGRTTVDDIKLTNTLNQDDFFLHYLAYRNGVQTMGINLGQRKYTFEGGVERCLERGFIKKILDTGKGNDSLWVQNKVGNDKLVHLFDRTAFGKMVSNM